LDPTFVGSGFFDPFFFVTAIGLSIPKLKNILRFLLGGMMIGITHHLQMVPVFKMHEINPDFPIYKRKLLILTLYKTEKSL
jgi:hypothetical protein